VTTSLRLLLASATLATASVLVGFAANPSEPLDARVEVATQVDPLPAIDDDTPRDMPGLHNIVAYREGVGEGIGEGFYSGSAPEGAAGFKSLAALGIKTILSVDGAIPDVSAAKAHGMRYAHLPIGYDGFDAAREAELVRAVRDLPKPLYLHCHHGKHRSAGAAAVVAVSLGWLSNDAAIARMKVSGTAPGYKGLWTCAAKAAPMMAAAIDAARADFPEVTKPDSMVASMVAIDEALERLKLVEKNGWRVPADHPDLAPAADAGKIADLLALLKDDAFVHTLGSAPGGGAGREDPRSVSPDACAERAARFRALLAEGRAVAGSLEDALAATPDAAAGEAESRAARLGGFLKSLQSNCKACHNEFRD
jgi:protein tyrosine phosphatase (PTP) superfamily phosphohydrolase (DUF442 family)